MGGPPKGGAGGGGGPGKIKTGDNIIEEILWASVMGSELRKRIT